ncbi:class I SAM-dependent methyltransferase [Umezawaea sp. NPDC059074]|uniref:class I SAM-dependent methyltransferase n=1 Tax=Umezawaea sp. NPDC059074 TaxID=3346716 RepID=UPI0036B15C37
MPSPDEHTRHLAANNPSPTAWFEELYAEADEGRAIVPWDRDPMPALTAWARDKDGEGRTALVVGCGLGRDSELIATRGYRTTAFDIAPTAVATTRRRFPDSPVDYRVADLLSPPPEWHQAFDLVVESLTVQSLPIPLHPRAITAVTDLVAPGGTLLVIAVARDETVPDGPPWPLTAAEIQAFAQNGLRAVMVARAEHRWCAEFVRG